MRIIIILAALFIPAIAAAEGPTRAPYMTQEQFQFSGDKHTQAQTWALGPHYTTQWPLSIRIFGASRHRQCNLITKETGQKWLSQ